jgi:hypothetical protein
MNDARRIALDVSRPDEPPLGTLSSTERKWLSTAFDQLQLIYKEREAGNPRDNAFCIFEIGNVYIQFLARWDAQLLVCEAVSAKSNPQVETILATEGDATLRTFGFEPPSVSPNYSQTIKVDGVEELAYAARLAFRVLKQVYHVEDMSAVTLKVQVPSKTARTMNLKQVLQQHLKDAEWNTYSVELYRQEGTEFRSVRLSVGPDGVRLDAQDMGPSVRRTWGDDDYEFWVNVPAKEILNLLFALLRERYAGRSDAVDEFRAFCEKEGINHKWDSWN